MSERNISNVSTVVLSAFFLAGIFLLSTSCFAVSVDSSTIIGIITSDAIWIPSGSPYTLTGPAAIAVGATLTIEPGVTVNLNNNYLQVNGTLVAEGTESEPITFKNGSVDFTASSISWNDQNDTGSKIENAIFVLSGISTRGTSPKLSQLTNGTISVYSGAPTITQSNLAEINILQGTPVISNNNISGGIQSLNAPYDLVLNSSPTITNNNIGSWDTANIIVVDLPYTGSPTIFSNTIVGGRIYYGERKGYFGEIWGTYMTSYGIKAAGNAYISDNIITDCTFTGIVVSGNATIQRNIIISNSEGVEVQNTYSYERNSATIRNNTITGGAGIKLSEDSSATINYNNLADITSSKVYLETANDVDATLNWWGTTDTNNITQSIRDSKTDFNLGTVTFTPFLSTPNNQATPNVTLTLPPKPTPIAQSTPTPTVTPTQTTTPSPLYSPTPSTTPTHIQSPLQSYTQNPTATPSMAPDENNPEVKEPDKIWLYTFIGVLLGLVVTLSIVIVAMFRKMKRGTPKSTS
jgi:hypothetical protein